MTSTPLQINCNQQLLQFIFCRKGNFYSQQSRQMKTPGLAYAKKDFSSACFAVSGIQRTAR
jgi:hypothetical protein